MGRKPNPQLVTRREKKINHYIERIADQINRHHRFLLFSARGRRAKLSILTFFDEQGRFDKRLADGFIKTLTERSLNLNENVRKGTAEEMVNFVANEIYEEDKRLDEQRRVEKAK